MEWRSPFKQAVNRLISHGYACVIVDARGSGASFGFRQMEWSRDEVKDGAEVLDWVVQQPWSDGTVASTGISYDGTAAEMFLVNRHPAVKAAIIRYALFNVYTDIIHPGGVRNEGFMQTWSASNAHLDRNDLASFARQHISPLAGLAVQGVQGVAPVDEDPEGVMLTEAIKAHQSNYDIYKTSHEVEFIDDASAAGVRVEQFSPHAFIKEIEASGAAIYSWSSWYDGAYTLSAINRFLNLKTGDTRLILGPWDHGGLQNPDPFVRDHKTRFDHTGEMLRFFDHHLKGIQTGIEGEKPVHYFTVGEEKWKSADTWPPPGFHPTPFYFADGHKLTPATPSEGEGSHTYEVDYTATSGVNTRWVSQVNVRGVRIQYKDRVEQDARLLVYDSSPLARDTEVTGHPIITLFVCSTTNDGQFFVYLEDLTGEGEVIYVTEGMFRAIHRKISPEPPPYDMPVPYHSFKRGDAMPLVPGEVAEITFDLQPISYLFKVGHSIRVAIAGADRDNFALVPPSPPTIEVLHGKVHPSHILLPLQER
jgi:putative CocE/NonD family hydrolase